MTGARALLIGYGNPGRGDDGLGPVLAQRIADRKLPGLTVEVDFQLTADHALVISRHDPVIFVDAAIGRDDPFQFTELQRGTPRNLGSHTVTPQAAVALSHLLFDAEPRAFVLGISGEVFGKIEEGLSVTALRNLGLAESFLVAWYADQAGQKRGGPVLQGQCL